MTAALAIANVVKSSFGPVGLDKMLVDDLGDLTITNDGATIVKLLEVEHPAGKVQLLLTITFTNAFSLFYFFTFLYCSFFVYYCLSCLSLIFSLILFQVLVEVSQLQDSEVGDGTTSVVLMAAELLKVFF